MNKQQNSDAYTKKLTCIMFSDWYIKEKFQACEQIKLILEALAFWRIIILMW